MATEVLCFLTFEDTVRTLFDLPTTIESFKLRGEIDWRDNIDFLRTRLHGNLNCNIGNKNQEYQKYNEKEKYYQHLEYGI